MGIADVDPLRMLRPSPESDLLCSICRCTGKPATGHLTLRLDAVDGVATVQAVDYLCSDRCLADARGASLEGHVAIYSLLDFDPFAHLDETVPKYAWGRGTIERFARMLSAITPWTAGSAPAEIADAGLPSASTAGRKSGPTGAD